MLKKLIVGLSISAIATFAYAQDTPAPGGAPGAAPAGAAAPAAGARAGRGGAGAAGAAGRPQTLPTKDQWDNMNAAGKAYVEKARVLAGDDNDLKFDFGVFCQASGGAGGNDRSTIGVPEGSPFPAFGAPNPAKVMPPQHMFDNMWWFGNTGVGAWLFTSKDGYILFDTMDNMAEARDIIVGGIKKVGLDPSKIKYVIFGHDHLDHTGGGHYIQSTTGAKTVMGRDDWEIYFRTMEQQAVAPPGPRSLDDKVPMTHGIDAQDGQVIKVGDLKATIYQMTGHTPGSIGMVINVKWAGKEHPILIVTAGTDVHNRESLIGGYEHIWQEGKEHKAESVMQVHPNTNMNLLARVQYVNDHFDELEKSNKNPLLYGAARTAKYIDIMDNCTLARLEALGW